MGVLMPMLRVVLPATNRAHFAALAAKGTTSQKLAIRARAKPGGDGGPAIAV
jgi:hypothetical protein